MAAVCFLYRKTPWRGTLMPPVWRSTCTPTGEPPAPFLGRCCLAFGSLAAAIGGAARAARRRRCVCVAPQTVVEPTCTHTRRPKFGPNNTEALVRRAERQPKTAQISRYTDRQRSAPQPIESHERALHFRKNEKNSTQRPHTTSPFEKMPGARKGSAPSIFFDGEVVCGRTFSCRCL